MVVYKHPPRPEFKATERGTNEQRKEAPTPRSDQARWHTNHRRAMGCGAKPSPKGVLPGNGCRMRIKNKRGRRRPKCPRHGQSRRAPPPDDALVARVRRAGYNALNPLPSPAPPPGGAKNGENQRRGSANPQAARRKGGWVPRTPRLAVQGCTKSRQKWKTHDRQHQCN